MTRITRTAAAVLLALVLLFVGAPHASADALVQVKVQGEGAVDGQVTLRASNGGQTYSCRTENRECRIDGVPGGSYRVEFEPERGDAPRPRNAMIPPSGTVTLVVSAGAG